jgi:hypothetical protein
LEVVLPKLGYWWIHGLSFVQRPRDEEVSHLDEHDQRKKRFIVTQTKEYAQYAIFYFSLGFSDK